MPSGADELEPTLPSFDDKVDNSWAGESLEDVESFCLDICRSSSGKDIGPDLFILVDSAGFQNENAIICERARGGEGVDYESLDSWNKIRLPWVAVWACWCNLFSGNAFLEDQGERQWSEDECEGAWYMFWDYDSSLHEEGSRMKNEAFESLKSEGRI